MDSKDESKQPLLGLPPSELPVYDEQSNPILKRQRRNRKFIVLAHLLVLATVYLHLNDSGSSGSQQRDDVIDSDYFKHHRPGHSPHHGHDHKGPPRGKKAIKQFLKVPNNESAIATSRLLTSKPHIAGSPQDFVTAKDVFELFSKEFKLPPRKDVPVFSAGSAQSRLATFTIPISSHPRAWIDTYYPVLNTPLDRHLQILDSDGKVEWNAELEEVADDDTDPDAVKYVNAVPTFHGLSKAGDVRGPVIHVGYGTKEEFDHLESKGINFTGSIVLTRYGAVFRGLKIKRAQEVGAVGVLIYSDPADDGGVTDKNGFTTYPLGPARHPRSVQRGSVQFISAYPGDPTTPGRPAYANVTRDEPLNAPSIPSLPISWLNAQHLLKEVHDGVGPSKKTIRLHNNVLDGVTPIWNTMMLIPGHIKEEIVMVGNHRDAWVLGGADPSSGSATLHEVVRGFADLWHSGWRPLRSIVIASWDAEEYGLVGSTEYGEDFTRFLSKHVVAYLNLDVSVVGSSFIAAGSPSLAPLLRHVAEDIVVHPTDHKRSLWDTRDDVGPYAGNLTKSVWEASALQTIEAQQAKLAPAALDVYPLGSGSDYTVFLQHIGIASSDGGFGTAFGDAPYHYHSIFDSEYWQETFADPGFHRHVAVARFLGTVALKISDAIILPINTTQYALQLDKYLDAVEEISLGSELKDKPDFSELRDAIAELTTESIKFDTEKDAAEHALKKLLRRRRHHKVAEKMRKAGTAVRRWLKPTPEEPEYVFNPYAELDWLEAQSSDSSLNIVAELQRPPVDWPSAIKPFCFPGHRWGKLFKAIHRVKVTNLKLAKFESGFISEEGITEREWYKHLGVAPGKWLGYGATTFPALTEAITIEKNATLVEIEAGRLTEQILKLADRFRK
ncbi:Zn-dependent exopeptidase [Auriculariales sp. MPI-PUGE-AT-0066]|nr:Zn-dependent exopeptidase [Auriculariales sp. MPI-PUGE-AT-0066]